MFLNSIIVLFVFIVLVVFGLLIYGVLALIRLYSRLAKNCLMHVFKDLDVSAEPREGDVFVLFHTYYGLLAYFTQTEFHIWAEPHVAKMALWRLHRFNLIWGQFAAGAVFIPVLSTFNYWKQRYSIRKQVNAQLTPPTFESENSTSF